MLMIVDLKADIFSKKGRCRKEAFYWNLESLHLSVVTWDIFILKYVTLTRLGSPATVAIYTYYMMYIDSSLPFILRLIW